MNKDVFQGIVNIWQTHAERLNWSMQHLADKQPYTAASLSELTGNA